MEANDFETKQSRRREKSTSKLQKAETVVSFLSRLQDDKEPASFNDESFSLKEVSPKNTSPLHGDHSDEK